MSLFSSFALVVAVIVSSVAGFTAPDPTNWKVDVGANGTLTFNPQTITASVGDTVTYYFHPKVGFSFSNTSVDFGLKLTLTEPFCHTIVICRSMSPAC